MEKRQYDTAGTGRFVCPVTPQEHDAFNAGLTGLPTYEAYRAGRDKPGEVVPYVATPGDVVREPDVVTAIMSAARPVIIGASIVCGVGWVVSVAISSAVAVAAAVGVWCAANTGIVTGAVVAVLSAVCLMSSRGGSGTGNEPGPGPGPGGSGEWEYYQEQSQRQGWRKK